MADFTEKYRQAIDSLDISPDFKQRTAAAMKAIRDNTAPAAGNADMSADDDHGKINLVTVSDTAARRRRMRRIMPVIGAAAACFALCVTAVKTGILDGETDIAVVTQSRTSPEMTDVAPEDIPDDNAGETVPYEAETAELTEAETAAETVTEGTTVSPAETLVQNVTTAAVREETLPVTAPAVNYAVTSVTVTTAAKTVQQVKTQASPSAVTEAEEPAAAEAADIPVGAAEYVAPSGGRVNDDNADDEEAAPVEGSSYPETSGVIGTMKPTTDGAGDIIAEPAMPVQETEADVQEADEAPAEVPIMADDSAYDMYGSYEADGEGEALDDPAYSYKGAVGYDFSAYDEAKKFDRKDAYAVITPLFEDYDEKNGIYISHDPGEVRGTVKIRRLISAAALYAEDGSWEYVSAPPSEARYIIDFGDSSGNSLRAYAGEGFICYAFTPTGGEAAGQLKYYYFSLSEEESGNLEELLAGNVK